MEFVPTTFEIQHRKGRDNANVDALSRLPLEPCFALKEGRNVMDCELEDQLWIDIFRRPIRSERKQPIRSELKQQIRSEFKQPIGYSHANMM